MVFEGGRDVCMRWLHSGTFRVVGCGGFSRVGLGQEML